MTRSSCAIGAYSVVFILTLSDTLGWSPFLLSVEVYKGLADTSLNSYTFVLKMLGMFANTFSLFSEKLLITMASLIIKYPANVM